MGFLYEKEIPLSWITHVIALHPLDSELIMYEPANGQALIQESGEFGSMITSLDQLYPVRNGRKAIRLEIGKDMNASAGDWVCYDVEDGSSPFIMVVRKMVLQW